MIELFGIIPSWFIAIVFAATLVVNRAGASKIFFDVVGTFQANRLIMEGGAAFTTFQSLALDAFSGIEEAAMLASEQIQEMVDATVPLSREIAAARIEFDKFIDDAEQARLGDEIKDIGVQFGFTGDQALRAGAKMAQLSGMLGEEAVPAATEMSLAFGMIGEMEAEQAMQRLINLHQQTGFMMRGTTEEQFRAMSADEQRNQIRAASIATLNELNAVEDHSAANMERITFVMNQFASQAHLTGESIAHMAAMSAVLIEAGEEQGKAGRALRMIYARLGADTNGAASELEALGIAVKKADGSLRPLNEILIDLDNSTVNLSKAERQRIAQTVAGNNHYVRMLKLMEGTERMQTLVAEATGNTAPIVDILNDRFNDMSVRLTQAETKLHNIRGEIGDAFLPAVTEATEKQVEFNQAYLDLVETPFIGDILIGITQFQQVMSSTLGPLMQMNLNFKQMTLGVMTTVSVMRALNGEAIAGFNKEERLNNLRREGKLLLQEQKNTKSQTNNITSINSTKVAETLRLEKEKLNIERFSGAEGQKRLNLHKQYLVELKKEFLAGKQILANDDEKIMKTKLQTRNYKRLNLLSKEERLEQQMINQALEKEIRELSEKLNLQRTANELKHKEFMTQQKILTNTKMQNEEIEKYNFQHLMKVSSSFMMMQMAAMGASMAIGPVAKAVEAFGIDVDESRVQMVMMAMVMGLTVAEMGVFAAASNVAATSQQAAGAASGFFASMLQTVRASALTAGTAILSLAKVTGVGVALILVSIGITKLLESMGVFGGLSGEISDEIENFNEQMGESAKQAEELMNAQMAEIQAVASLASAYKDAGDEIQGFSNAREELFFGFKAGNVTGDLVKQVQQQGVENFVAHTEVIMTNNFTGLMPDEIADIVIAKIDERIPGLTG